MPEVNKAVVNRAGKVGGRAIVVSMLSTETPTTSLPKRAIFDRVTWGILIAFKAIWESDFISPAPFTKYHTAL